MSKRILSVLAILALSGCGPMDDDSALSLDEEDGEDDSALLDAEEANLGEAQNAVTGTSCSNMADDAKAVLVAINDIRTKMGMAAINCNDAIQKAANAHAKYQFLNGSGHSEVQGKPGFTGVNGKERAKAAGYAGDFGTEVICAGCTGVMAVNAFMRTVYHRSPFVSFSTNSYGFGSYNSKFSTIDFGRGGSAPSATKRVVWPIPGATGVPTSFSCGGESPNPCDAGLSTVGSPISLTGGSALTVTSTKLVKAGTTTALPLMVRKSSNDSMVPVEQVYMIPKSPLTPATKYTATVVGSLNNVSFTKTWSFTTQ